MSPASPRRPWPWSLALNWVGRYLGVWFLLAAVIFIVQTVLAAVLHERNEIAGFMRMLDRMPKIFKAFIGGDDLMPTNVLSIVAIGYQHPLILTSLMINAVIVPSGLLTAESESGTMELLLARPITRMRIFILTAVLSLVSQVALVGVVLLGTAIWTRYFDYGEEIPLEGFVHVTAHLAALGAAVVGLSLATSVWLNERAQAIGIVVAYLVGSYLMDFSAVWLPSLKNLHPYTLFYYCRPNPILAAGEINRAQVATLLGVAAVSMALAAWRWRRRDLYTA